MQLIDRCNFCCQIENRVKSCPRGPILITTHEGYSPPHLTPTVQPMTTVQVRPRHILATWTWNYPQNGERTWTHLIGEPVDPRDESRIAAGRRKEIGDVEMLSKINKNTGVSIVEIDDESQKRHCKAREQTTVSSKTKEKIEAVQIGAIAAKDQEQTNSAKAKDNTKFNEKSRTLQLKRAKLRESCGGGKEKLTDETSSKKLKRTRPENIKFNQDEPKQNMDELVKNKKGQNESPHKYSIHQYQRTLIFHKNLLSDQSTMHNSFNIDHPKKKERTDEHSHRIKQNIPEIKWLDQYCRHDYFQNSNRSHQNKQLHQVHKPMSSSTMLKFKISASREDTLKFRKRHTVTSTEQNLREISRRKYLNVEKNETYNATEIDKCWCSSDNIQSTLCDEKTTNANTNNALQCKKTKRTKTDDWSIRKLFKPLRLENLYQDEPKQIMEDLIKNIKVRRPCIRTLSKSKLSQGNNGKFCVARSRKKTTKCDVSSESICSKIKSKEETRRDGYPNKDKLNQEMSTSYNKYSKTCAEKKKRHTRKDTFNQPLETFVHTLSKKKNEEDVEQAMKETMDTSKTTASLFDGIFNKANCEEEERDECLKKKDDSKPAMNSIRNTIESCSRKSKHKQDEKALKGIIEELNSNLKKSDDILDKNSIKFKDQNIEDKRQDNTEYDTHTVNNFFSEFIQDDCKEMITTNNEINKYDKSDHTNMSEQSESMCSFVSYKAEELNKLLEDIKGEGFNKYHCKDYETNEVQFEKTHSQQDVFNDKNLSELKADLYRSKEINTNKRNQKNHNRNAQTRITNNQHPHMLIEYPVNEKITPKTNEKRTACPTENCLKRADRRYLAFSRNSKYLIPDESCSEIQGKSYSDYDWRIYNALMTGDKMWFKKQFLDTDKNENACNRKSRAKVITKEKENNIMVMLNRSSKSTEIIQDASFFLYTDENTENPKFLESVKGLINTPEGESEVNNTKLEEQEKDIKQRNETEILFDKEEENEIKKSQGHIKNLKENTRVNETAEMEEQPRKIKIPTSIDSTEEKIIKNTEQQTIDVMEIKHDAHLKPLNERENRGILTNIQMFKRKNSRYLQKNNDPEIKHKIEFFENISSPTNTNVFMDNSDAQRDQKVTQFQNKKKNLVDLHDGEGENKEKIKSDMTEEILRELNVPKRKMEHAEHNDSSSSSRYYCTEEKVEETNANKSDNIRKEINKGTNENRLNDIKINDICTKEIVEETIVNRMNAIVMDDIYKEETVEETYANRLDAIEMNNIILLQYDSKPMVNEEGIGQREAPITKKDQIRDCTPLEEKHELLKAHKNRLDNIDKQIESISNLMTRPSSKQSWRIIIETSSRILQSHSACSVSLKLKTSGTGEDLSELIAKSKQNLLDMFLSSQQFLEYQRNYRKELELLSQSLTHMDSTTENSAEKKNNRFQKRDQE